MVPQKSETYIALLREAHDLESARQKIAKEEQKKMQEFYEQMMALRALGRIDNPKNRKNYQRTLKWFLEKKVEPITQVRLNQLMANILNSER